MEEGPVSGMDQAIIFELGECGKEGISLGVLAIRVGANPSINSEAVLSCLYDRRDGHQLFFEQAECGTVVLPRMQLPLPL